VAHVGRQQLRFEGERGRGNQVVRVVDPAVGAPVPARQRAGRSRDALLHGDPGEHREELLERFELLVSHAREKLEPDNLAGHHGFLVVDELVQEIDCRSRTAQVVDRNARVQQLQSTPSRRRRSFSSPRSAST
jgi:hypothetical protein